MEVSDLDTLTDSDATFNMSKSPSANGETDPKTFKET